MKDEFAPRSAIDRVGKNLHRTIDTIRDGDRNRDTLEIQVLRWFKVPITDQPFDLVVGFSFVFSWEGHVSFGLFNFESKFAFLFFLFFSSNRAGDVAIEIKIDRFVVSILNSVLHTPPWWWSSMHEFHLILKAILPWLLPGCPVTLFQFGSAALKASSFWHDESKFTAVSVQKSSIQSTMVGLIIPVWHVVIDHVLGRSIQRLIPVSARHGPRGSPSAKHWHSLVPYALAWNFNA